MNNRTGPIGNRARMHAAAVALQAEGLSTREIAERLKISRGYAHGLLRDPDGSKDKARKDSYAQPCVDCGARTSGAEGRKSTPRCVKCAPIASGKERMLWPAERIIAAIQDWNDVYGEPPTSTDWNPTACRNLGDEDRAVRFEQGDNRWPWMTTVVERFGTWNAAIQAAGFTGRAANGGHGNMKRHRRYGHRSATRHYYLGKGNKITMEAIVLRKNGNNEWVEVGRTEARSHSDAIEALATTSGTYTAVAAQHVFEVAPVSRLTATPIAASTT